MEVNILIIAVEAAIGFVLYFMSKSHDATKERLSNLEANLSRAVMKEDFREFKEELFKRLDRIENDLKGK